MQSAVSSSWRWTEPSMPSPTLKKALPERPFTLAPTDWTKDTMLSGFALEARGVRESKYRLPPLNDGVGSADVILIPRVVRSPSEGMEIFSLDSWPASAEYPSMK